MYVFGWSMTWCPGGKPLVNRVTMVQFQATVLASRRWRANGNSTAAHSANDVFSSKTLGGFMRREVDELHSIAFEAGCLPGIANKVYD
jgi:hypothetical protein